MLPIFTFITAHFNLTLHIYFSSDDYLLVNNVKPIVPVNLAGTNYAAEVCVHDILHLNT